MCMQCMATAAASVGTAAGLRAWLAHKVSPTVARRAGIFLMGAAVLVSGVAIGGTG